MPVPIVEMLLQYDKRLLGELEIHSVDYSSQWPVQAPMSWEVLLFNEG